MLASPIAWIVAGYLLGSIPFGLLLARAAGIDIRQVGSGNIGATNVLRTGNKGLAAGTLLLDAGKGFAAVWLARQFGDTDGTIVVLAGFAAFIGHLFPVWLNFRGGKGVATMLGVTLALSWWVGLVALLVWLVAAVLTRYSSVGGMLSALVAPIWFTWALGADPVVRLFAVMLPPSDVLPVLVALTSIWLMALLLIWKHAENIARLRAGTESRIGSKE